MNNQNSKCCEKCVSDGTACQRAGICPCHTTSKSEAQILDEVSELPKDFWDKQKVDAFNSITLPRTRLENWEEKSLFETRLAIFIDFVEKEANRIDEERRGAHRKDGGRKMQSILFLKSFISTLLQEERGNTRKMITGWVNAMWDLDILDHDDWTGPDEVVASIMSYVEGKHLQSNEK